MDGTLHSFFSSSRPLPRPLAVSQDIRDRSSSFVAYIFRATSPDAARTCIKHLKHVEHNSRPATHEIAAWRCMVLKPGSTGLCGPDDFELKHGHDDDGEKWAGNKVLKVMEDFAVIDAVVIVSRWYGGVLLGPARFTHIETCAEEVCREFKKSEELQDCITTLTSLDDLLAQLRSQLKKGSSPPAQKDKDKDHKKLDYSTLDIPKAKRLIAARENSIKSCKSLLAKQAPRTS
ncbi:ribosomal protein S5 domain 2-type protein [Amanita rubescens]|nr:ribosomal protein S5 domain 2-type protein [Amanita rubescens]